MALCIPACIRAQTPAPEAGASEQQPAPVIGRLLGDDVEVRGAVQFESENGVSFAMLSSGAQINVRSGQAEIELTGGGEIAICGPAQLSVLKAGGALTIALDYGRVHPRLDSGIPLKIYTPLVIATPVAIGQGPRDLTVSLDSEGKICAHADRGALRVEQQLSGESLLVPQGGDIEFTDGVASTPSKSPETCRCDLLGARQTAPAPPLEMQIPLRPPVAAAKPVLPPTPPVRDVPESVDRFDVPLTFNANQPDPPGPDPQTLVLVREVRFEPDVVFEGHVDPPPELAAQPPGRPLAAGPTAPPNAPKKPGIFARIFGWLRRH